MDSMLLQVGQAAKSLAKLIERSGNDADIPLMESMAALINTRIRFYKESMREKAVGRG